MVYGCVRHILICTEILMSSSAGMVLCTFEHLKLFYTTICCAVAEWKKKSETNMNHMVILWLRIRRRHTWHEDQNAKKCLCPFSGMHTPTSLEKKICWVKNEQHKRWGKLVANAQHSSLLGRLFIHKTIRHRTLRSHMHCTGLYDIQIPTKSSILAWNALSNFPVHYYYLWLHACEVGWYIDVRYQMLFWQAYHWLI